MRANPFREPLEGVGPENRDFLGPEMATSEASAIWAQKKSRSLFWIPVVLIYYFYTDLAFTIVMVLYRGILFPYLQRKNGDILYF